MITEEMLAACLVVHLETLSAAGNYANLRQPSVGFWVWCHNPEPTMCSVPKAAVLGCVGEVSYATCGHMTQSYTFATILGCSAALAVGS